MALQDPGGCEGGDAHPVPDEEDHVLGSDVRVLPIQLLLEISLG